MADLQGQLRSVERNARETTAKVSGWIRVLARAGYAALGVSYGLAGTLAVMAAFYRTNGTAAGGSTNVMVTLLDHPYGWIALALIAAGLAGQAVWCLVLAVADPERKGRDLRGLGRRFVDLFKMFVYLGLVAVAAGTLVGIIHASPGRDPVEQWTARLMSLPLGIWLVGIAGGIVLWVGGFQVYRAGRPERLDEQLRLVQVEPAWRKVLLGVSRFGVGARGLVFLLVGAFLIAAAYHANPHEAKGVGRALAFLRHQWQGRWLLTAVALGLLSYGLFQFVLARYRQIDPT